MFICGMNGSGKSRLANRIASAFDRVLVFEPKGDDPEVAMPNAAICWGVEDALKALPGRVIYHPTPQELPRAAEHFDRLVWKIWALGGAHAIVAHETRMLGNSAGGFQPWLTTAYVQGRSRGVPIIGINQRPVDAPREAISEAAHYVAFFLQDERDRKTLSAYMGPAVIAPLPLDFSYWYCGKSSGMQAVRCAPLS